MMDSRCDFHAARASSTAVHFICAICNSKRVLEIGNRHFNRQGSLSCRTGQHLVGTYAAHSDSPAKIGTKRERHLNSAPFLRASWKGLVSFH